MSTVPRRPRKGQVSTLTTGSPPLARMVVRVNRSLSEDLTVISARLHNETMDEYSYSAIVRGLIRMGLERVAENDVLHPLFEGTRVRRGRKPGSRWSTIVALDLIKDDDDLDIEPEDKHHDALNRKQIVARGSRPPRQRPSPKHPSVDKGMDDDTDPDDDDTGDDS